MADPDPQSSGPHPPRSWQWVTHKTFAALPFYRRAWQILKRDWLVFLWKLIVDVIGRIATAGVALLIVGLFVVDFQLFTASQSPFAWVGRVIDILRSPDFIAGTVGLFFFATLITTALEALVVGGIWGILDRGLRNRPIDMISTFFGEAIDRFPEAMLLFLLKFAVRMVNVALCLTLVMVFYHGFDTGVLAEMSRVGLTAAIAVALTFFFSWSILTRIVVETIAPPLMIDDVDFGEAILRGAHFALDNFWSLYRLVIFALGVFLIPLGIYFVAIMTNNLLMLAPSLAPLGTVVQLTGELVFWTSITVVGVFFYGALFAFYYCDDDEYEQNPPTVDPFSDDEDDPDDSPDDGPFREGTDLDDFIPDEAPNRFPIDDVLASDDPSSDDPSGDDPSGET